MPGLPRRALARRVGQLMEQVQALMRERLAWQDRLVAPVPTVAPRSEAPAVAVALREVRAVRERMRWP